MRLKQIGAQIIVAGVVIGVLCKVFSSLTHRFDAYGPLAMFVLFAIGALIGVTGMIVSAFQRRKNSN
jgi:F0F1-type ATP synthase assembly protein I